jgi:hypothetical protein
MALEISELRGVETGERDRWFAALQAAVYPPEMTEQGKPATVDPANHAGSPDDQQDPAPSEPAPPKA